MRTSATSGRRGRIHAALAARARALAFDLRLLFDPFDGTALADDSDDPTRSASAISASAIPSGRRARSRPSADLLRQDQTINAMPIANSQSDHLPAGVPGLWLGSAGGLISAREETGLDSEEESTIMALEHADWLGAVVGLIRTGVRASAEPESLVRYIDACPEVDGTVDPDEASLKTAFELVVPAWEAAGAVDETVASPRSGGGACPAPWPEPGTASSTGARTTEADTDRS
jgi:hypothetical protein